MKTTVIFTPCSLQGTLLGQNTIQRLKIGNQNAKLKNLEVVQTFKAGVKTLSATEHFGGNAE